MTIEVSPVGVKCNLSCSYCYEVDMRSAGNFGPRYNLDAIFAELDKTDQEFTLFGGEPLLMAFSDLERILAYGFKKHGRTGIQTNGTLIDEDHIELFQEYNTHVGVSFDGPGRLNDVRGGTEESIRGMNLLLKNKVDMSLIVTLHQGNSVGDRLEELKTWFRHVDTYGITGVRLHLMEDDGDYKLLKLYPQEMTHVLLELLELQKELKHIRFDLFHEMRLQLEGKEGASCIWLGCDPYTTPAVHNINGDGTLTNCGRTNKDGVDFQKADRSGNERQVILYNTPQSELGCKDCRFFLACHGECPGTGENNDWRNRTTHCASLMALFGELEKTCEDPVSLRPNRKELEMLYLHGSDNWEHGDVPHGDKTFLGVIPLGRPESV